jgi:arabinoxylan arabinofuranohydrolase
MKKHKLRSCLKTQTFTRKCSVFFVILAGFFTAANAQTGLKDVYANHFRVGNILNGGTINDNDIKNLILREFNSITHENELKPDQTMTRQGSTDDNIVVSLGSGARNVLKFCEDNNIAVRGHVLVWHGQSPHWFFTSDLTNPATPANTSSVNWATKDQMEKRLKSYINNMFALLKRDYPNLNLYAYDVVNEAADVQNGVGCPRGKGYDMDGAGGVDPTKNGNSPWVQIYGDNSFIESAFKYADEARDKYFPNMKLFYNDYNEWETSKRDYIINQILIPLRDKGYLDGMGMQGHVDCDPGQWAWSRTAIFTEAMDKYAALGIEVHITELDIGKKNFTLQQQATKYKEIFEHAIEVNERERAKGNPGFTAIVVWGPNDGNSWRNDDEATLFDRSNQKKDAYNAVFSLVPESEWGDGKNPTFQEEPVVCEEPEPTPTPDNLVSDGIFSGTRLSSSWSLTNVDGGAEASASVACNKATITITQVGEEMYQPQLIQQGITLEQGKTYEFSFKASAAANRTIIVQLERMGTDEIEWGHIYGESMTFNLTSTEETYTFTLDMTDPTDENVQLAFNLGGAAVGVTLSDVVLVSTGTKSITEEKPDELPAAAQNPILTHKYTADPNAFIWNDRIYVYASFDNNNPTTGGYNITAYTLISSDDMVNWTDHGEVFQVKRDMSWANQSYAPGAAVKNNKVYLYVPDGGSSIGVVYADKPEGPFTDPNKKALINKSMTNCNVPWLFDPAGFVDDDGKAYLYFGGGDTGAGSNLRGIELNDDMISVNGTAVTITDTRRSFEAAFVHKENGKYYFSYSTNFSGGPGAAIDYCMSSNPLTGYTYTGTMFPNPSINGGNNHAHPVKFKDKWYLFYHDRRLKRLNNVTGDAEYRSVSVDVLEFNTDGTMKSVSANNAMPAQIKNFNPYQSIIASTFNSDGKASKFNVSIPTGKTEPVLGGISDGSYVRLKGVDFGTGATKFTVLAASNAAEGGKIEIRTGSATGTLVGTCDITNTGSWETWKTFECNVSNLAGVKDYLYLVFKGMGEPFRLSSYQFFEEEPVVCEEWGVVPTPDNLVSDGTFSGTTLSSSWSLTNVDGGAEASASVACNKATISITQVGEEMYQPQLIQQGITLEQGKTYEFSFKASAAANRTIIVQLERMGTDEIEWGYIYGGAQSFNLTSTEETYTFTLDMTDPTDENVQLAFNLGGETADVTLSDVVLISKGEISMEPTPVGQNTSDALPVVTISDRTLSVSTSIPVKATIYDLHGNTVSTFGTAAHSEFPLNNIPAGIYLVTLKGQGVDSTVKIVLK